MDLPVRKKLPHTIPQWVAEGSWFFITIKCVPPGENQLCRADTGAAVLSAMKHNHEKLVWHCRLCLLMPDHLHAILALPARTGNGNGDQELEKVCGRKTGRGLATRFFRSPSSRPSRTGREDQLHPDESGVQRFVRTRGRLDVGVSPKRPSATATRIGLQRAEDCPA